MRASLLPGLSICVISPIFTTENEKEDIELNSKESESVGWFEWQDIPPRDSFCEVIE